MKTSGNTIFQSWGGGGLWDNVAHKLVEIATFHESDSNDTVDSSLPPVIHRLFLTYFTINGLKEWLLKKTPEVRLKRQMLKD